MDTRRDFIKKAALLAGAAGMANVLPMSIQKALAINAAPGSTFMDAEHVVILMQENRSFDHCFGALKGVRGFNDPRAIDLPNKNKVWLQSNDKGETYAPFHLDIKNTKATWMNSLPHSWQNQVNARNDGKMDQWLNVKRSGNPAYENMPLTLGYHTREDLPFYYALADAFTICDQNFCSSLTGTTPNRLYFWSGTIREEQNENSRACVWNDDADNGTLKWTTFPERLEDHGISWKVYQNELSIDSGFEGEEDAWLSAFTDNPLEFFAQYNVHLHPPHIAAIHKKATEYPAKIKTLEEKIAALPETDASVKKLKRQLRGMKAELAAINKELEKWKGITLESLSEKARNIHKKAFDTNIGDPHYRELATLTYDDNGTKREMLVPKGDVLHQFREDAKTGKLPTVSWIVAPENFSDHPGAPWYGAWYVSEVMDILTKDPEVWKKTIFILAYDENDGYFDHVPPFVAPHSHKAGTGKVSDGIDTRVEFVTLEQEQERKDFPEKFDRESPIGLGYRVPLIIASPWSKGGFVNSEVFDHTSTLQFLEKFLSKKTGKKITEPNISEWRRTVCGDLTSVFRPYHGEQVAEPAFLKRDAFVESIHKAKFKKLPDDFKILTPAEIAQANKTPHLSPYMPKQERGIKPSCALPYDLNVNGMLSKDKKSFEITFTVGDKLFGTSTTGAPFNVYAPGKFMNETTRTWAYAVKAGDSITDSWPLGDFENGQYHLRVYGPNGFYREFKGNTNDPHIDISCGYQHAATNKNKPTGNMLLLMDSPATGKDLTVEVIDNAYKAPGLKHILKRGAKERGLVLDLTKSHGWYDFTIRMKGHNAFEQRFAGRIETGRTGYSDPQMSPPAP